MIEVKVVQDDSSHWYTIPKALTEQFYELSEDYNKEDEFDNMFGHYRTGGGLNLIQLYAEI